MARNEVNTKVDSLCNSKIIQRFISAKPQINFVLVLYSRLKIKWQLPE